MLQRASLQEKTRVAVPEPFVQSEAGSPTNTMRLLRRSIVALILTVATVAVIVPSGVPVSSSPVAAPAATPVSHGEARTAAGPSPLLVAEAYFAHWDAGEVAESEALVSPDANLFTQGAAGQVAIESWYRIATGVRLDRSCNSSGPEQVRCETTLVSGLQPGVVIADAKPVVLSVSDGLIVDFQFPSGFQTVYDDDIVGLDAYREWMAQHEPGEFKQLFLYPETIVVNSEEARSRHREMISKFLESGIEAS